MNHFLAQIVLARRNEDFEGWMNVLFVVVLAIFWALGGILKARKNAQSRQKEQAVRKPARRPPAPGRGLLDQLLMQPQPPPGRAERRSQRAGAQDARTKLAEIRAAARKFAAEAEEAFRVQVAEQVPEPPPVSPKPAISPAPQANPAFVVKPPIVPEYQPAPGLIEATSEQYLDELLSDYADSGLTRRAILHYEILGRPLALRDPQEPATGL